MTVYEEDKDEKTKGFWATALTFDQIGYTLGAFVLLPFFALVTYNFEYQYLTGQGEDITEGVMWFGRLCLFGCLFMALKWLFDPILHIRALLPLTAELMAMGKIQLSMLVSVFIQFSILGFAYLNYNLIIGIILLCISLAVVLYLLRRLSHNRKQDLRSYSLDDIDI